MRWLYLIADCDGFNSAEISTADPRDCAPQRIAKKLQGNRKDRGVCALAAMTVKGFSPNCSEDNAKLLFMHMYMYMTLRIMVKVFYESMYDSGSSR